MLLDEMLDSDAENVESDFSSGSDDKPESGLQDEESSSSSSSKSELSEVENTVSMDELEEPHQQQGSCTIFTDHKPRWCNVFQTLLVAIANDTAVTTTATLTTMTATTTPTPNNLQQRRLSEAEKDACLKQLLGEDDDNDSDPSNSEDDEWFPSGNRMHNSPDTEASEKFQNEVSANVDEKQQQQEKEGDDDDDDDAEREGDAEKGCEDEAAAPTYYI
ncbi:uncharacterized protein LOC129238092 [Anastrepha obliqua]|uniref:uncharacterized protein LOC129238092 n=1 Tax=Anastrepha obliqua TaxID=95512 RepID=UPI0024096DE3|nr:uncharacterized protein LOC129238092 [Anastrepha obliqua]